MKKYRLSLALYIPLFSLAFIAFIREYRHEMNHQGGFRVVAILVGFETLIGTTLISLATKLYVSLPDQTKKSNVFATRIMIGLCVVGFIAICGLLCVSIFRRLQ